MNGVARLTEAKTKRGGPYEHSIGANILRGARSREQRNVYTLLSENLAKLALFSCAHS